VRGASRARPRSPRRLLHVSTATAATNSPNAPSSIRVT
jgi:hypothetical protein